MGLYDTPLKSRGISSSTSSLVFLSALQPFYNSIVTLLGL